MTITYIYKCPFCETRLTQEKMQFHVGIPLCMKQRKAIAKTTNIPGGLGPIPVDGLKYKYFGSKGIHNLILAALSHHPDDPPLDLPSFVDHSED